MNVFIFWLATAFIVIVFIWIIRSVFINYTDKDKNFLARVYEAIYVLIGLTAYFAAILCGLYGAFDMYNALKLYQETPIDSNKIGYLTTRGSLLLGISGILLSFGLSLTFYLVQNAQQRILDRLLEKRIGKKLGEIGKNELKSLISSAAAKEIANRLND